MPISHSPAQKKTATQVTTKSNAQSFAKSDTVVPKNDNNQTNTLTWEASEAQKVIKALKNYAANFTVGSSNYESIMSEATKLEKLLNSRPQLITASVLDYCRSIPSKFPIALLNNNETQNVKKLLDKEVITSGKSDTVVHTNKNCIDCNTFLRERILGGPRCLLCEAKNTIGELKQFAENFSPKSQQYEKIMSEAIKLERLLNSRPQLSSVPTLSE